VTEGATQCQLGGGRPGARKELLYECRAIAADLGRSIAAGEDE
jgi:hypothetical protein